MTNEYELADDNRESLIWTKEQLLAPLLPGMEQPPHDMRLGETERDYYNLRSAGVAAPADAAAAPASGEAGEAARAAETAGRVDAGRPGRRRARRRAVMHGGVLAISDVASTTQQITFWLLAVVSVTAALGMILVPKAVYCAVLLAVVMLSLAVLYALQNAPFLAFVQVIVYTGAVLMLFLFVLMIVGIRAKDSLVETIKGQRAAAGLAGIGLLVLLSLTVGHAVLGSAAAGRAVVRRETTCTRSPG